MKNDKFKLELELEIEELEAQIDPISLCSSSGRDDPYNHEPVPDPRI
jgi:hypothetical protein